MTNTLETLHSPPVEQWALAADVFPGYENASNQEAARRIRSIGSVALSETVIVDEETQHAKDTTLMHALQNAAFGDQEARSLVNINVSTDYAERLFKSKHQTKVRFNVNNNRLVQNGRDNVEIQENTFEYSELNGVMHKRSTFELRNAILVNQLMEIGVFETHSLLVASPTPTDQYTRDKYNFFQKTDTMSLQLIGKEDNEMVLETAFVAGKTSETAQRHDIDAITEVARVNGVDINLTDVDGLLDFVMLVPNSAIQNGVVDIVRQYDDAAGGTFYGELEQRQDYISYAESCEQVDFGDVVDGITERLITEAHTFTTPIDANIRLDELSGEAAIYYAIQNDAVDEDIFGSEAAQHIRSARQIDPGVDPQTFMMYTQFAVASDQSSSCPFARDRALGKVGSVGIDTEEDEYGSLTFECGKGHTNTRPRGQLIPKCTTCGDSVSC